MRQLLVLLFLALPMGVQAQDAPRLVVEGRGEVAVVPDMATVTVTVLREAEAAEAAMSAASEAASAVLGRIEAAGVDARDVQTGQVDLQPVWDHSDRQDRPRVTGYAARNVLTVRVRDLGALGGLLDAVVSDGANMLDGLSFGLNEPRPVEDEARRAAFADAMAKATLYAEAAGMTLGPILSLSEGDAMPRPGPTMMMEAAQARSVPIAPGEVTQTITVTLEVELAPAP
jgi:uncharacterized protein YggE